MPLVTASSTASPITEQYTGHRYEFRTLGSGRICCSADHLEHLCEECQQKAAASNPSPAPVRASAARALRATAARITADGRSGTLRTAAESDRHFAETLGFNAIFDRTELPAPNGYLEALTTPTKPVGYRQADDNTFDSFGGNPPDPYAIALRAARGKK